MEFFTNVSAPILIPPLEEQLEDIFVMSVLVLMKHLFPYSIFCLFSWIQNLKDELRDYKTQNCLIQATKPGSQGPNESIKAGEEQKMHWGKPEKIIPNFESCGQYQAGTPG